jgi:putative transposase
MIIAHKIALDPKAGQESYFARACGTARFAYNWALAEWKRQHDSFRADNGPDKDHPNASA